MSTRKIDRIPGRRTNKISRQAIFNLSKGLNNYGAPSLIKDTEWADLQNIQFDESGVVRKRYGFATYCDTLTAGNGLGSFKDESKQHTLTVDNGTFKYTNDGTSWATDGSVSFSTNTPWFTQARGSTYILDGYYGGAEWDGTTLSRPGTIPKAKFSYYYQSYHIAAGVEGQPNRVYISVLGDASDFTNDPTNPDGLGDNTEVPGATVFTDTGGDSEAAYIDILPEDGDEITGLGEFQDILIIFKQFSVYQMSIDADGVPAIQKVTSAAGCVSARSVITVENDLYFLSREGVRRLGNDANYFNSIRTSILTKAIKPLIDEMSETDYSKATAIYHDNEYILSIPDSQGNLTRTIVYNTNFRSWTKWTNIDAGSFVRVVDSDNMLQLVFLEINGTQAYKFTPDVYTDNGTAINAYALSKVYDFGSPDITKYFVDLGFMFRTISGELDVEVYTEGNVLLGGSVGISGNLVTNGMGVSMLGSTVLGENGGESGTQEAFSDAPIRIVLNTKSTSIRFKIANNRNNENFILLAVIHAFYPFSHYLFDSTKKYYL